MLKSDIVLRNVENTETQHKFFSPFPPRRIVIEESWLVHYRYMFALCNVSKVSEETKNDLIKSQTYNVAGNMI